MPFIDMVERMVREEGLEAGMRKGMLRALAMNLSLRFGESDKELVQHAESIENMDTLEVVLGKVYMASSLDEVQKLIAASH